MEDMENAGSFTHLYIFVPLGPCVSRQGATPRPGLSVDTVDRTQKFLWNLEPGTRFRELGIREQGL